MADGKTVWEELDEIPEYVRPVVVLAFERAINLHNQMLAAALQTMNDAARFHHVILNENLAHFTDRIKALTSGPPKTPMTEPPGDYSQLSDEEFEQGIQAMRDLRNAAPAGSAMDEDKLCVDFHAFNASGRCIYCGKKSQTSDSIGPSGPRTCDKVE